MGMKTAISIPDDVFADADALAHALKTSRSENASRSVLESGARYSADPVAQALAREVRAAAPAGPGLGQAAAGAAATGPR